MMIFFADFDIVWFLQFSVLLFRMMIITLHILTLCLPCSRLWKSVYLQRMDSW
jgi:hypothetical protein